MEIKFGATFQLNGVGEKETVYVPQESLTIGEFLLEIMRLGNNNIHFFESDGSINEQKFVISINNIELGGRPEELGTKLKDGDFVFIEFPMLGGG